MKSTTPLVGIATLLLASCASIVSKSEYPVSVSSVPPGAEVKILKNGTPIHQGLTPTTVTLKASAGFFTPARYDVVYSKKGCRPQTVSLVADIDGWYFGNLLFGGLPGLLIVDPATGAMFKLPENVNANLTPIASLEGPRGTTLQLVDRSTLPKDLEARMVAVR